MVDIRAFLIEVKLTDIDSETEREYLQKYQELNHKRVEAEEKIESMYEFIDATTMKQQFVQRDFLLQKQEEWYVVSIDCENKMKALEESSIFKCMYEKLISKDT